MIPGLEEQLQNLLGQERSLSRRRQQLHRRIEYLQGTAALDPTSKATVDGLIVEEQEVSLQRQEVHAEIDRLRGIRPKQTDDDAFRPVSNPPQR